MRIHRLFSTLLVGIGLVGVSSCEAQVKIGSATITPPSGWRVVKTEKEVITFGSTDEREQTTISLMTFDAKPSFEEFKRICSHRLKAEETEAPDISLHPDEPFEDAGTFGMFFSGTEEGSARLFSGFITQKDAEVITVYVESVGVDSKRHFQSFQDFVKGLKR